MSSKYNNADFQARKLLRNNTYEYELYPEDDDHFICKEYVDQFIGLEKRSSLIKWTIHEFDNKFQLPKKKNELEPKQSSRETINNILFHNQLSLHNTYTY